MEMALHRTNHHCAKPLEMCCVCMGYVHAATEGRATTHEPPQAAGLWRVSQDSPTYCVSPPLVCRMLCSCPRELLPDIQVLPMQSARGEPRELEHVKGKPLHTRLW